MDMSTVLANVNVVVTVGNVAVLAAGVALAGVACLIGKAVVWLIEKRDMEIANELWDGSEPEYPCCDICGREASTVMLLKRSYIAPNGRLVEWTSRACRACEANHTQEIENDARR
jgi:hypothetical protein